MKIFVTGGSGYIGSAVIEALHGADHQTLTLARSRQSAARLEALGSRPLIGDTRHPQDWISQRDAIDGVIHLAATFDGDMATAKRTLLHGLLDEVSLPPAVPKRRFIYPGSVWLYGPDGGRTAVEGAVAQKAAGVACEAWDQTMATRAALGWAPRHASILEALAEP